jgi:hypothetical protein
LIGKSLTLRSEVHGRKSKRKTLQNLLSSWK